LAHRPHARGRAARRLAFGVARLALLGLLGLLVAAALAGLAPRPASAEPEALPVPPAGGLTQGVAGTSEPAAIVAAQAFDVETVSMLVPETQTWLVFIPRAPAAASTLSSATLTADSIVTLVRVGSAGPAAQPPTPPNPAPAVSGEGTVLDEPPRGGLVLGVAGTNDPATLAARQGFAVDSVSTLHVASQTWLVYVPSAPAFASSLRTGMLDATTVVTVRRAAAQTPTPTPTATPTAEPAEVKATAEQVMLASINEERVAAGLPALTSDPTMVAVARAHSRDMLARDFFDHVNPDGDDPFDRMRAAGVDFGYAAENIVTGQSGASAHATLMASPPHRANILGVPYRRVGVGAINRPGGGVIVTEVFAD